MAESKKKENAKKEQGTENKSDAKQKCKAKKQ